MELYSRCFDRIQKWNYNKLTQYDKGCSLSSLSFPFLVGNLCSNILMKCRFADISISSDLKDVRNLLPDKYLHRKFQIGERFCWSIQEN